MKLEPQKEAWMRMYRSKDSLREVIDKMVNIQIIRSRLEQALSDPYNERKRNERNALSELLNYNFLMRSRASSGDAIERKQMEIGVVPQRLRQAQKEVKNWPCPGGGYVGTLCDCKWRRMDMQIIQWLNLFNLRTGKCNELSTGT